MAHLEPAPKDESDPRMAVVVPIRQQAVPVSDAELVDAAVAGDERAKEQLYRRHAPMVFGLAHRVLGRRQEVDDLVQDSFATAFERLSRLRDGQAFASWLATIVVRTARTRIRRKTLMRRLGLDSRDELDAEQLVSQSAGPEVQAELSALYEMIERLPANVRMALILRRVEGLTIGEIASHLGLSPATVKRHIKAGEVLLEGQLSRGGRGHAAT